MPDLLAQKVARAIEARTPLPVISQAFTLAEAYALQHDVTSLRSPGGTDGIKAGVTTRGAQRHFGIDHGLIASLYQGTRLADGAVIPHIDGRILECEVAVLVDEHGTPKAVAPAIEIVHLQFARPEDMTAANLVLCNLGSDEHIVGEFMPWADVTSDVLITMRHGANVVNEARSTDALGGPEHSVPWIWEEAAERGFARTGDRLVMTGSCGRTVASERGEYAVEYGALGKLTFEIS